jgi:hypothetical protein
MAKPSLNPDRAKQGGGGVEAGNYEVSAAKFAAVKTDYRPNQLYMVLETAVLDKDGDAVRGADPVEIMLSFGQKSLEAFHPGEATGPEDADPGDLGDSADTEGNSIYCSGEESFNKSSGALVFMETLAKAGFPKPTLDRCYAPDLVGLKFRLDTITPKEANEKYALRLNTKPFKDAQTGENVDITYKVVSKWLNPNYLSSGGKKSKSADSADSNGTAAAPKATDPDEIAKNVLALVAKLKAGEKNKVKTKAALVGFFTNEYAKSKQNPKQLAECQKLVKNDEWLTEALSEIGAVYDEGVTTFPDLE